MFHLVILVRKFDAQMLSMASSREVALESKDKAEALVELKRKWPASVIGVMLSHLASASLFQPKSFQNQEEIGQSEEDTGGRWYSTILDDRSMMKELKRTTTPWYSREDEGWKLSLTWGMQRSHRMVLQHRRLAGSSDLYLASADALLLLQAVLGWDTRYDRIQQNYE